MTLQLFHYNNLILWPYSFPNIAMTNKNLNSHLFKNLVCEEMKLLFGSCAWDIDKVYFRGLFTIRCQFQKDSNATDNIYRFYKMVRVDWENYWNMKFLTSDKWSQKSNHTIFTYPDVRNFRFSLLAEGCSLPEHLTCCVNYPSDKPADVQF